jgi:hypothetical protein
MTKVVIERCVTLDNENKCYYIESKEWTGHFWFDERDMPQMPMLSSIDKHIQLKNFFKRHKNKVGK